MATADQVTLTPPHHPHELAIEAFTAVEHQIKSAVIKSRHDWDKHEPRMWERAAGISNHDLTAFSFERDLVEVRTGSTAYGTIIFGKIRVPAIDDGYIHVRIHDPPNRGTEDVIFHSIYHYEGDRTPEGHIAKWQAVHTRDTPLDFFNE